ncbi:hypothetical protein H114_32839 [Streptomyces gancidicus BKS 13-15]|uniref:Minor tail protein n=1 Tax=Streptomyces gancidicus BKS 13-15 TaxID=1284664 RepID=M3B9L9_STREZ|nr:hypothetical protein [Streptomyces gancidicus]EMF20429.1 hypothetical protein H114_32839 [Streptomyces gancidicus BKS 13-15]
MHSASVIDRDGAVIAHANVLVSVEWSRVLDDVSTAHVIINPDGDCCAQLGRVRSWRHKLVIARDAVTVWEGPIINAEWSQGQVELWASDVLAWLDRRVPHQSVTFDDADLTDIAAWLIGDGFAPDDPGHRVEILGPAGVRGGRAYVEDDGQTGDHLRDLADTGLDYTAVGSTIALMPETWEASVGTLTDVDFPEGLVVAEDGAQLATRVIVHGDQDSGVKGVSGGADGYYGLLELSVEQTSVKTQQSADEAARSRRAAAYPVPVFLSSEEVTLSPEAAVDVAKLVPGWCVDVATDATCRSLTQRLKVQGLKVSEDGDGESVQVVLAPITSDVED